MDTDMESAEDFLAHYGVRGMHWGQRKAVINEARGQMKDLHKVTKQSEAKYASARSNSGRAAALRELKKNERIEWDNKQVAKTLTRGEQVFIGVAASIGGTPLLAAGLLGATTGLNRDSKKFKSKYPTS
jgi:hypothetical protein